MNKIFPFPIGTLYCIGRNYAEHAKELKNEIPAEPVVFLKPRACVSFSGQPFILPNQSQNVHHEGEIVVAIGKEAWQVSPAEAHSFIYGYGVGIDFTARDLQDKAKAKGLPWTLSKGLPGFAGLGNFTEASEVGTGALEVELTVNGTRRQIGDTSQMLFSIPTIIAYLSRHFRLAPGDLIYTGTPSGVGPVVVGDEIVTYLRQSGIVLSEYRTRVIQHV